MRPANAAPAFGRIDLEDGETHYIGYEGIMDPDNQDVLVVNWRTPVGAKYEQATAIGPGDVSRKRAFTTEHTRILDFDDLVFAELSESVRDLISEPEFQDALLADLDRSRSGQMHDVVKTIQAAQSPIMRAPLEGILLVQGAPGTGKTVVALHRVSWLLYNYADELSADQVLVVGPTPAFTRYIRGVLPALGDRNVREVHIDQLSPAVSSTLRVERTDDAETRRMKGEARMSGLLRRALIQRISLPDGTGDLTVRLGFKQARFQRAKLQQLIDSAIGDGTLSIPYMQGRTNLREYVRQEARQQTARLGGDVRSAELENLLQQIWPQYSAPAFLQGLYASKDRLLSAADDDFTGRELTLLHRRAAERVTDESWSTSDVPLLDEVEALLNGWTEQPRYRHVVVDEAQDLSPMQLRALARRAYVGSMTIVGDIAQSTGPWARDSWDDVLQHLPQVDVDRRELEFGYRVPREVYELAARLLPRIAPGTRRPRIVRDAPAKPQYLPTDEAQRAGVAVDVAQTHAHLGRSVGLIVPDAHREAVRTAMAASRVAFQDVSVGELGGAVNLVGPLEAKGLEFDTVVVVEPEDIVGHDTSGERLLYVALTRTTKYLTVVHAGAALPLDPALETPMLLPPRVHDNASPSPSGVHGGQPPATRPGPGPASSPIAAAIAKSLADQMAGVVSPDQWDTLLELLIDELATRKGTGPEAA
jgi:DNA helicase IV